MNKLFLLFILILTSATLKAQDDLLDMLDEEAKDQQFTVEATFKGTRLINGHSIETRKKKNLDFIISHRFGRINSGSYELFGLDQATIRLGLEYGLTDRLNIAIGRNSFEKTYDGFLKYRLLQQLSNNSMPISATLFTSMTVKTLKQPGFEELEFNDRIAYVHQVLLARKMNSSVSVQLMPTFVHFNSLFPEQLQHDIFALGVGGRMKLSNRVSLNLEYYYRFQELTPNTFDAIAIGFDIETGGHVFQLHFTNSRSMIEKGFIAETFGDFFNGDIHFGFNISRTFQFGKSDNW